jgi:hypothetical protein
MTDHIAEIDIIVKRFDLAYCKIRDLIAHSNQTAPQSSSSSSSTTSLNLSDEPDALFLLHCIECLVSHGLRESFFSSRTMYDAIMLVSNEPSFRSNFQRAKSLGILQAFVRRNNRQRRHLSKLNVAVVAIFLSLSSPLLVCRQKRTCEK